MDGRLGVDAVTEQSPKNGADPAAPSAQAFLDAWITQVVNCTLRGTISVFFQAAPEVIILATCRVLGKMVGAMYVGEINAVMEFRRKCRHEFYEALKAAPIQGMPTPAKVEVKLPPSAGQA